MVYHMRPENPIRKRKKWLSDSEQLKMIDILNHRANPLILSPAQALNMLSSTSWAHSGTPCWEVSSGVETYWEKFETGQTTELTHFLCFAVIHVLLNKVECIYTATLNMLSPRTRSAQRILRSQPWFNMSPCEIFGLLNMLSHCWGHLKTTLNNTSTNIQHVESLYSGQIQCICTQP